MSIATLVRFEEGVRRLARAGVALAAAFGAAAVLAQGASAPAASTATPATPASPEKLPPEMRVATPLTGSPRVRPAAATLDAVRSAGVLRVGVVVIPPWALPGPAGELVGFEVDVARKLAADLGVRLELVRTTLAGYAGDLSAGRFDIAAAGLWPTPSSALLVNFSQPYAVNSVELLGNTKKLGDKPGRAALNKANVSIGVRAGSHSEAVVRRRFPQARVVTFDTDERFFEEFSAGKLDAIVAAAPVPDYLAASFPKSPFRSQSTLATRREAFAIERGDADFLAYLNAWIVFHEDIGWLEQRRNHWFRSLDWMPKP
jgi:polar amino acid transport system substrate-binding protein